MNIVHQKSFVDGDPVCWARGNVRGSYLFHEVTCPDCVKVLEAKLS